MAIKDCFGCPPTLVEVLSQRRVEQLNEVPSAQTSAINSVAETGTNGTQPLVPAVDTSLSASSDGESSRSSSFIGYSIDGGVNKSARKGGNIDLLV